MTASSPAEAFIGRQPIYDRELHTYGYELLYRDSELNRAVFTDMDEASRHTLFSAVMDFGLEHLAKSGVLFVNVTPLVAQGATLDLLPKDRIVLEALEMIEPTPEWAAQLESLAKAGFTIALDDYVYSQETASLLQAASIIKLDVMALSAEQLKEHVRILSDYPVRLLAEKVETYEEFEQCKALGFDYFQGYFFCKPRILRSARVPVNRLATLTLLAKLQDPELKWNAIEPIITRDPSLSFKLLRSINSALFALPRQVDSVRQALVLLGERRVRSWASMLALSRVEQKPPELVTTAMVRGRMCQILGAKLGYRDQDALFTVGLFSTLDAFLDAPLPTVMRELPLADTVIEAVVDQAGEAGTLLALAISYERGEWDHLDTLGLPPEALRQAYEEAVTWADTAAEQMDL